jgi:hypothetical protein
MENYKQEIQQLQEEIITLKMEQPYHPSIKTKILELESLINARKSTEQTEPTGYTK